MGVSPTSATHYLYDGWNRIAEFEKIGTGQTLERTYLWGMDLSGSMQGAGGVGGLLSMHVHGTGPGTFYPTYDGNGNISEYVDEEGEKAAHFEYDPFGNLTVDTEENAADFPYRFSTKPQDLTTGLYYYGYRWYDPATGRWPSRDPIGEQGGTNLYGFVGNDGLNGIDLYGLSKSRLYGQISAISMKYGHTEMAKISNLGPFITTLLAAVQHFVWDVDYSGDGEAFDGIMGVFNKVNKKITLYNFEDQYAVHEVVHAWQSGRNMDLSDEKREGMAYAAQYSFDIMRKLAELENTLTMHGGPGSQEELRFLVARFWDQAWLPGPNNKTKWETSYQSRWLGLRQDGFVSDGDIRAMSKEFNNFGLRGVRIEEYFNSLPVMMKYCTKVSLESYIDSGRPHQTGEWRTYFASHVESVAEVLR